MIKIVHKKPEIAEQEYFDLLRSVVSNRLNILKLSLQHLNGSPIDESHSTFDSTKVVTKKIIKEIDADQIKGVRFVKGHYTKTVQTYLSKVNNLEQINLNGLIDLVNFLLDENNLRALIICSAHNLESHRNGLMSRNSLTDGDIPIIGLAFDYEFKEINDEIKKFFREKNLVKYCPYCNLKEIEYLPTESGKTADGFDLDHFFDKVKSPLLAFSMYNLVPADKTCNGAYNKGRDPFSDEFHLNPYISGVGHHLQFMPKLNRVDEVLDLLPIISSDHNFRKKMIGDNPYINEDSKLGNVNVFKLKTKYKNKVNVADKALGKFKNEEKGRRSIIGFLSKISGLNNKENYTNWYQKHIDTSFYPSEFHLERYSKLNRDIHDFYYSKSTKGRNKYIQKLIEDNIG